MPENNYGIFKEDEMKIAYLINCHKNMDHVAKLAHCIHSDNSHIFIHVDKKVSQETYDLLLSLTADLEHCFICQSRIDGKLDDRSLVDIVMILISSAKKTAEEIGVHYSYYCNMSGQDYPIKPIPFIEQTLSDNYPDLYISCRDSSYAPFVVHKYDRNKALIQYRNWSSTVKNNMIRKFLQGVGIVLRSVLKLFGLTAGQRIIKNGWNYYQGSAWWILPDCAIQAVEMEYYGQTKLSAIMLDESTTPEETYFQSVVMQLFFSNSAQRDHSRMRIQKHKTYADFGSKSNRPIVHHPYVMTMSDFDRLCESECFFARKFDNAVDSEIIDKIDEVLIKK